MLRFSLFLTLAASCAAAATITTHVDCGDGYVVDGTTSASCWTEDDNSAGADIYATREYRDSVNFYISAAAGGRYPWGGALAWAEFRDDYVFNVTGGWGAGFVLPCMDASADSRRGEAGASVGFGGSGISSAFYGTVGGCGGELISPIPFRFGVLQIVEVSMTAGAWGPAAGASATLWGFKFVDNAGNPFTNVHFTLVSTSVPGAMTIPEPGTAVLLMAGILCLVWVTPLAHVRRNWRILVDRR